MRRLHFFVLASYILVVIGRIQELFTFLRPLHLGDVFGALSIVIVLSGLLGTEKTPISWKIPEVKYVLGMFFIATVSVFFSVWTGYSLKFMSESLAKTLLFFFLILHLVRTVDDVKKVLWVFIIAMWLLSFSSFGSIGRWSTSSTYDPNDMALIIVVALPFVAFFISENKGLKRLALILTIPLLLYAFVATASRGGFIGLVVVSGLILFKGSGKKKLMPKVMFLVPLGMILIHTATPEFWDRMSTIWFGDDYNLHSEFGRKHIWKRGVVMMFNNPLFGVGPGCFDTAMGLLYSKTLGGMAWRFTAHNSFVLVGAELGVLALLLFVALFYRNIRSLRRVQKEARRNTELARYIWLANSLEVGLWGFVVCGFFLSQAYHATPYFLIALAVAFRNAVKSSSHHEGYNPELVTVNREQL